ncbi:type 1 glutamine amidotransferase domain-containing protein [Phytoactinopolyspora endophytica]|uniref:type 1 glutamine amidotransferase domain-containing protein n=1 Tax=Phytoactinopolyspora endophytica TaxID=1642495 RepID=UPI00101D5E9B|nr:type 1 glutamine amidotransferase domain-containing protein [Phytoactinopolyspora endophytica]
MAEGKRVLLILTSNDDLGGVRKTGYYVGEAANPWDVFTSAGSQVDVASISGGIPPEDGRDETSSTQRRFLADPHIAAQLADTAKLDDIDASTYDVVFFVGGHGTMWDFPNAPAVDRIGREVYEGGGVVAAVCHGPAALTNITLSEGTPLVAGKRVAAFTNEEEAAVGLTEVVPFLLADALTARGATHVPAAAFTENVVIDDRVVTGQNPQSAAGVARGVLESLSRS